MHTAALSVCIHIQININLSVSFYIPCKQQCKAQSKSHTVWLVISFNLISLKLGELETQINSKFKKIENKLKKEMKDIFQYQSHEISKIKVDIQGIKEELNVIKQSEETITQKGMTKLSKLSKEVKTELNEIKKLKTDVNGLKKEVIGIRQSEEDLSKMGMDKLAKMNEDFKSDVKQLRTEMKSVKKDIVSIKVASNKKMIEADPGMYIVGGLNSKC